MLRSRVPTLVVLACLSLMACLHALGQYDPSQIMNALQTRQTGLTLVTSHRGEINGPYANNMPENSVGSALNAIYGGIEMIEADVWTTQDHIPYLAHDKTTYRMLNIQARGYFNPDPNGQPAVNWSDISGKTLCAGRGITDVAYGGSGQCTVIYSPVQTQPSLSSFMSQILPAVNQQGQTWGGVVLLDIRDQDSLIQSWTALVNSPSTPNQVVFKLSPLVLGLNNVQDLVNLLAASPYYHGQTGNVVHDLAAYMNFQPTYITNLALKQETATGDPNWAINDWNNNWLANAGSFHRLLAAEVSVKGSPGEFISTDTLYQTVTNGPRNAISMYSGYYECYGPEGPQNLPNLPPGGTGFNGYWINNGLCNFLSPSTAESADGIDHRYDYNFITGHTSPNTPDITNPPNFGMIIADNAFSLINYLNGSGQRSNLASIRPHCSGGSAYPGCNDPNTSGQSTYTYCAPEGGTCTFSGDRNLVFGANGIYTNPVTVTNSTACNRSVFGDPLQGVVKACYLSPPISYLNGIYCGDEDQYCYFQGSGLASIAANQKYYNRTFAVTNGFQCDANSFGWISDPIPGYDKACFILGVIHNGLGPQGYTYCSTENGTCLFKGLGRIAYGASGEFNYRVLNGGTPCNNSIFGDPNSGYTKGCWYQVTTAASGSTGTSVGNPPGGGGTSTCDIYASGGTPCVAAHSTVRALFGGYSGRLYQVQRASDGQTLDIGTSGTGGYANSASQDSFCAGTRCAITIIYDQTSNNNDLTVPGGDYQAVASDLPIAVNGGNKAYGVKVTPGVGYRNNVTRGVAAGSSPEGMYMVTSGTYVNGGCCFDYGNAETNSADDGAGRMDALNFGTYCEYGPCNGSGPWVEADLENGQYMGNGNNPNDQSMGYNFVTAMLKNDGTSTFALKGGNSQSGALTTDYSGTLPTNTVGGLTYIPMNKQGAIILGTGGDNSDTDIGAFFEGAMTSGYPTDATENSVQANIVTAGYACDSSGCIGGGGTTTVSEPPGPYTGPSDPGGPGPQDGFASPAALQSNDLMGSKPALASFNGSLFVAFQANDPGHTLHVSSSSTGSNFPAAAQQPNVLIGGAPAMAAFKGQLYIAFQANDPGHTLHVTSSPTGYNFPAAAQEPNILIGSAPAMTMFNGQLCISFQANDPGHTLHVTCSSDGATWPTAWQIPNVAIGSAPAMTVFRGILYIAFRADDPSNDVWIASSSDGVHFGSQVLAGQTMDGNSSPALVVSNNVLYYIYDANDTDHEMLVTASTDGSTWQGPAAYLGVQMGAQGPGAAAFGDGITVGFQSNDSRNVLFVTHKATEADFYNGPNDPGGPGPQDAFASLATEQPNDLMGSKPALAAFNGSLFVAFQANDPGHTLHVSSSSTGNNFPAAAQEPNVLIGGAPAMAAFNNQLYIAFQANDPGNTLHVTSSSDGVTWPAAAQEPNILIGGAPAMAVFNNQLCISFQANDPGHALHVTCSSDGVTWPTAWQVPNVAIGTDPAMAVFNKKLYVAFRADDPSNDVWIASSSDGVHFGSQVLAGQTMGSSSSPALAVSNCTLYYIYGANDFANEMLVSATTDGANWQGPAAYLGNQMGATGPGAAAFGNGVWVGFQSNDSRNVLFTTSGVGGLGLPSGPCQY